MERRLHPRVTVQFEAKVSKINNLEHSACGHVSDISNAGISVAIPMRLAAGELVQVEIADSVLTGHVVYSKQESSLFRIGIEIEQIRLGTTELANFLQRTLNETMPETPGLERPEPVIC
jgi:hypothetical protein